MSNYEVNLQKHLQKCELEYHAKHSTGPVEVEWLKGACGSVECIADFLRSIGCKVKRVVDEEPCPGEIHQWVETTNGLIVYANSNGLVARAWNWRMIRADIEKEGKK